MPRADNSIAKVRPTGPPPTTRTWVAMVRLAMARPVSNLPPRLGNAGRTIDASLDHASSAARDYLARGAGSRASPELSESTYHTDRHLPPGRQRRHRRPRA